MRCDELTDYYHCNKCGIPMEFQERKYLLVEVAGDDAPEKLGIHICPQCKPMVVDFINEPLPKQKRNRFGRFER